MGIEQIRNLKQAHEEKKPRTRYINPKSEKRVIEEKEYLKKRQEFLRKHPVCMARIQCVGNKAKDCHHMSGRSGNNYLDESTWLAVCRKCHTWITLNSKSSIVKGLSNSRLKKA